MSGTGNALDGTAQRARMRLAVGVVVPLAVVVLAYALWWVSDRLLYVGPLDRAAFGWAVVFPVWLAAPVAAGIAWGRLTSRHSIMAALVLGVAISAAAAALFWQAVAFPDCVPTHTPADWVLPSLLLGGAIGGGVAVSGLVAASLAREGRRWSAVVLGAGVEVLLVLVTIIGAGVMLAGPGCQRSPV